MQTDGGARTAALLIALAGCHSHAAPEVPLADAAVDASAPSDAAGPAAIVVRATTAPIVLDGDWTEKDWNDRTMPAAFVSDSGEQARPYSEIRFLHDDAALYVGLYAADEDIESTDFFQITIGTLDFRVFPSGKVLASVDGVRAASDIDGTVDHPGDFDEEWLVEISVPRTLVTLDATPLPVRASRCDVTLDQVLHCGAADVAIVADDAAGAAN